MQPSLCRIRIRDENTSGSGRNILDPQNCRRTCQVLTMGLEILLEDLDALVISNQDQRAADGAQHVSEVPLKQEVTVICSKP
jgi:hypothetical protein